MKLKNGMIIKMPVVDCNLILEVDGEKQGHRKLGFKSSDDSWNNIHEATNSLIREVFPELGVGVSSEHTVNYHGCSAREIKKHYADNIFCDSNLISLMDAAKHSRFVGLDNE